MGVMDRDKSGRKSSPLFLEGHVIITLYYHLHHFSKKDTPKNEELVILKRMNLIENGVFRILYSLGTIQ